MTAWYKEWFGEDYIDVYTHRNAQEAFRFIQTLENTVDCKPGMRLLDLCCGTGRYSVALAERGYDVTGIDLSEPLIEHARAEAARRDVNVEFLIGDMREIPFRNHFDGILNMFTSFGYFRSDDDNKTVIRAVADALKDNGWFVLDFLNSGYVRKGFEPCDKRAKGDVVIEQRRSIDERNNRIEKRITLRKNGAAKEYIESVKLYSREQLETFFIENGIRPVTAFGDYKGEPYAGDSPRTIIIGKKDLWRQ